MPSFYGYSTIIDHLSKAAAEKTMDYWENTILADSEFKTLLEENGGSIFCDSLELGGNPPKTTCAMWTQGFLDEFKARRGYDLTPYLPAIAMSDFYPMYGHAKTADAPSDYNFGAAGEAIRQDYYKTLTELYSENHIGTIAQWAKSHNMTVRYQVYGQVMEWTEASLQPDIIETESLASLDAVDMYRAQSGAVHLRGDKLFSAETAAVNNLAWAQTWTGSRRADTSGSGDYWAADGSNYVYRPDGQNEDAGLLYHINRLMAGGVNRSVLHGFSYHKEENSVWPGDSSMARGGFCNEWDDKTPLWEHIKQMTAYLSRAQLTMQQGLADIDLAVYRKVDYEESLLLRLSQSLL